jgi:anti-sigma28 factor (negative regulator of flagellin synthesis)
MKVFDVTKVYGVYEKQAGTEKRVSRTAFAPKSDKLSLSKDAKDFQAVMKGLKEAADTRADKVAEFSQKYEAGGYGADVREIAGSLLSSGLFARKL